MRFYLFAFLRFSVKTIRLLPGRKRIRVFGESISCLPGDEFENTRENDRDFTVTWARSSYISETRSRCRGIYLGRQMREVLHQLRNGEGRAEGEGESKRGTAG